MPNSLESKKAWWPAIRRLVRWAVGGVTVISLIGLSWTVFYDIDPFDQFRGVDKAREILALSPQSRGADIGQKWAIEHLYKQDQMPQRVNLARVPLRNLDLRPRVARVPNGADLQMAIMPGAILEHAHLECANLWAADLRAAFLTDAKLQYSRLFGARLQGADLSGADLTGADLTQANLSSADLRGATVTEEQLAKACADPNFEPLIDKAVRPAQGWPVKCERWTKERVQSAPPPKCLIKKTD